MTLHSRELKRVRLCACGNLRRTTRALTQLYDEALKPCGLHATQFSLLATLATLGPATLGQLAAALLMDRTTLTRNLRLLEQDGLVESVSSADRRTHPVQLSPKGARTLARALPLWAQAQARIVAGLGEAKFRSVLADLKTLTEIAA